MVFGLFSSRKKDEATRTPSPSTADKQSSPARDPPQTPSPPPEDTSTLWSFIQTIPPQTFHAYALARLHPSHTTTHPLHPQTLSHLSSFFADLQPPPQLHCVRCHNAYFDIENTDRSCHVPHDDESAEVERVSSKAKGKASQYETLYHCCGKTVEGDGDMGPPDGWCYEGQHTTDPKRARFRADSTMHDDKLVSCERLRCGMPPRSARAATRKRGRPVADEGDEDEDAQSTASSHPSASTSTSPPRSSNGNGRKKPRTLSQSQSQSQAEPRPRPKNPEPDSSTSTDMDVDVVPATQTQTQAPGTPPSPKPTSKPSPRSKPQSRAKPKSSAAAAGKPSTTPKTSSPLVLAPPFVSRESSPERPSIAHVIKSSAGAGAGAGMAPPASASAASPVRTRKDSASSVTRGKGKGAGAVASSVSASASASAETQERTRKDSSASAKSVSRSRGKTSGSGSGSGKTKDLGEVVDSSVDAERASGWVAGA
ncbi:hypothetical protein H0H92_010485 [Tricholoma furcatifolium]|nr:hypothetical protein H0H92_010485 [Tricholoma furcatifolium]